jgi:hypothetical protein
MGNGVCLSAQKMKKSRRDPVATSPMAPKSDGRMLPMGAKDRPIACAASEYLDICAYPVFPKMVVIGAEIRRLPSNWRNKAILCGKRCPSGWHAPLIKRVWRNTIDLQIIESAPTICRSLQSRGSLTDTASARMI